MSAMKFPIREAVGLGLKNVFGCHQGRRAWLVFNKHLRIAGNVFAPVTRNRPRINIETASRRGADDYSYNFTLIKRGLFGGKSKPATRITAARRSSLSPPRVLEDICESSTPALRFGLPRQRKL
jgi:hypothetical protein